MAERQEEFAIMMKQIQELQAALAHPEVQQVLKTLEKGKARVEDAAPTVTLPASQAVKKLQRDVGVGTSKVHEASAHDEDSIPSPTYSPNYSFMNNLEDLGPDLQVPPEDSTGDSSRDARVKDTKSNEKKIPVHPDSQKIKKKTKHHKKKRTFKSGDKDVKFEYYNAAGAGLTGSKMARRTGGVEEFGFEGLGENHQQGRLAVGIAVSGFLNDPDDFTKPWRGKDNDLEMYALRWETKTLMAISTAIQDWLTSSISKELMKQGAMLTVLSTLLSALAWPSALLSLTDFIDSKWSVAVDRSDKAGKLLADVLLRGLQGNRPVTLMGFSLGARVIFKCLEKLAEKGENGSIVERVVLLGAPLSIETQRWQTARKVVAGRFINAYSTNDWVLAVVYRASLMSQGLAGIQPVDVPGIENIDVTDVVNGHSSYLSNVGDILKSLDLDSYFPVHSSNSMISGVPCPEQHEALM
ncbi:hypothetical protein L7F22_059023 [Adiantum nelumboides]|nr:hypothetical protein [Adiantum nelumboides]